MSQSCLQEILSSCTKTFPTQSRYKEKIVETLKKIVSILSIALLSSLFVAACGSTAPAHSSAAPAPAASSGAAHPTLHLQFKEMAIVPLDGTSVPAGEVTFTAKNVGTVVHEMIVLKTDTDASKIALDKEGMVSEDDSVGEISELEPGKTGSATLNLKPGHYALVCNQPGHYAAGMYLNFTVTP